MKIVGIDLAGVESKPTGFCILDENLNTKTKILFEDKEIIKEVEKVKPKVVSIDAPLALPKGRCCLRKTCKCRKFGHFRKCDLELRKMGIKFFPITLGPMRKLTLRGIKLRKIFERKKIKVIESFPGSIQDVLKMPRKQKGLEKLRKALIKYGFKGDVFKKEITDHELDAITSALVGKLYLEGDYLAIGDPEEILMILPKPKNSCKVA
jgi:predicted nuclease with RNAse H fold